MPRNVDKGLRLVGQRACLGFLVVVGWWIASLALGATDGLVVWHVVLLNGRGEKSQNEGWNRMFKHRLAGPDEE